MTERLFGFSVTSVSPKLTPELLMQARDNAANVRGEPVRWTREQLLAQCRLVGLSQEATDAFMREIDEAR